MVGYFTAGVMLLLGLVLITKYGRELKLCYVAGGVFIVLGIWWAINTMYPDNPIIDGWLGWVVKGVAAAALVGLALYFFVHRKKEVEEFKASKEKKRETMYEQYDDYKYEDEKDDESQPK